ncbi:MAG TPA: hypothetical protein VHB98_20235, partial [Chloroflexota bacterium]|nr:hypothetical protein [Chloroflexota bacterium]
DLVVCCSKGTYIRALARDLGQALGCGAFMAALRRLASGGFTSRQAVTLDALERRVSAEGAASLRAALLPMDAAVAQTPAAALGDMDAARAGRGISIPLPDARGAALVRLYGPDGDFLALASPVGRADRARPEDEDDHKGRPYSRASPAGMAEHGRLWHPDTVFARKE